MVGDDMKINIRFYCVVESRIQTNFEISESFRIEYY